MAQDMSTIRGMVSLHAKISDDQAIMAIEAVLAFIDYKMLDEVSETVITKILASNADSTGGYDGNRFMNTYTTSIKNFIKKYDSIKVRLEALKTEVQP